MGDWRADARALQMARMGKNPDGTNKRTYTQRQKDLGENLKTTTVDTVRQLHDNTPGANDASVTWNPQHFTPQLEGQTQVGQTRTNTRMQAAQLQALNQLKGASHYGATQDAQEAAAMNAATTQAGAQNAQNMARARQQAIARGARGGGQEVAQTAAGTGLGGVYGAGTSNMVNARQRALQALGQSATMGGSMYDQGMGEKFTRGEAQDAAAVRDQGRTVAAGEQNANVDTRASMYNSQNPFRSAQQGLVEAGMISGNTENVLGIQQGLADQATQRNRDIVSGLGQGATAAGQFAYQNLYDPEEDQRKSWKK